MNSYSLAVGNHRPLLVSGVRVMTIYLPVPFPICLPHPLNDVSHSISVEDRRIWRQLQTEAQLIARTVVVVLKRLQKSQRNTMISFK